MNIVKTPAEIKKMEEGGKILAKILHNLAKMVKPGITTAKLEEAACKMIKDKGGKPSFLGYGGGFQAKPFPTALCTCINQEIVHAPALPSRKVLSGDLLSIDVGLLYKGMYTDTALTVPVGKVSKEAQKLIKVTKKSLELGIKKIKPKNTLKDIAEAIQKHAESHGFSVVRELVGHGVGRAVHEDPKVPNYVMPELEDYKLVEGMTLALEPMICQGGFNIKVLKDGWTAVTADGRLAAHFEHTVVVTKRGCQVLTI